MPPHKTIVFNLQKHFLIACLVLLLAVLLYFISPFLGTVIIAAVIVAGCYPLHQRLMFRFPRRPTLTTLLTLLIVTLIVLTPITLFVSWVASEAGHTYAGISDHVNTFFKEDFPLLPSKIEDSFFGKQINFLSTYIPISAEDLSRNLQDAISRISTFLVSQTTTVLKQFSLVFLHIIIFFLSLFYFFRDGEPFIHTIRSLLPLPKKYRFELFTKLNTLSRSIIYGVLGGAVAQGLLGGIGFYLSGIPNAAFWGSMMAFFSPLPYVGTAIIWIPAVIYMLTQGSLWIAVFLLFWCIIAVSLSDNLIKPFLIGESSAIHPLLVLLVLLGSVFVFGLKGVILGPFLLSLTLTFLHIYSLEYREVLNK